MTEASVTPLPGAPRVKQRTHSRGLTQAYEIRDFAYSEVVALMQLDAGTLKDHLARSQALLALARTWMIANEAIRIMRGRGLPKSVMAMNDPERKRQRRWRPAVPIGISH